MIDFGKCEVCRERPAVVLTTYLNIERRFCVECKSELVIDVERIARKLFEGNDRK